MQKDVIYIDTEDDITSIIGKVKASKSHIVALVPPKRIGAIQSAVNLKLVHRATSQADKRLVIITNNQALTALAASTGIPVAKNLQSKPEMPELSAVEIDDEDIIDGNELPAGERAKIARAQVGESEEPLDEGPTADTAALTAPAVVYGGTSRDKGAQAAIAKKSHARVPNFDAFRKKLFIGIAALALIISFLVWAIAFAPRATIVIKAKTSDTALNTKVTAGPSVATSLSAGTVKAEVKTSTKDVSLPFSATGKKDVGDTATGTVRIKTDAATILISGLTVPSGTAIGYNGLTYYTTDTATFPKGDATGLSGVVVGVKAAANGSKYNGATGSATTNADGVSSVTFVSASTGGTDKTVTVVQQSDIDTVAGDVVKSADSDAAKQALTTQYTSDYIVIADSFKVDSSAVKPSPAAGQESTDSKATLAGKITYSIVAIPKSEAAKFLDAYFAQQIDGKSNQKVYDNGLNGVSFANSVATGDKTVVTVTTNGKIGPKIDDNDVKQYAKGKKAGEIKAYVEAINGVENADINLSPFWVTTAPGDVNKINVQFNLNG